MLSVAAASASDVAIRTNGRTASFDILAIRRLAVGFGTVAKSSLGFLVVLLLTHPANDASLLQCFAVRKGKTPRKIFVVFVHSIEVYRCSLLVVFVGRCLARKEEDSYCKHPYLEYTIYLR